jgi:hypothetical protein
LYAKGFRSLARPRNILENRFVVLTAVEHANDGNLLCVHGAIFVVGDAQAGPYIIAHGAAMGNRS